jgi:hypothetical protein
MEFHAEVTIEAGAEAIWGVLADAASYPDWDSGVISVEGAMAAGSKISVLAEVNPKRAFGATVTEFRPGEGMTWRGGLPLGLVNVVRTFTLSPEPGGSTRFVMHEQFTGPLTWLMRRMMPDLQPSLDQFTQGLKARVEGARAPSEGAESSQPE